MTARSLSGPTRVVVATTVALSFISFWRAAAIVLNDLASTMFYIGGIAEQAIGKPAPWMVLAVMVFSYAVRSVYMESCSMFVRGGVYIVVRDSMGPTIAKLSVSSLIVDYILTGPISSVSAGQYLGRLFNELSESLGRTLRIDPNGFAVFFAVAVTVYFWRSNVRGLPESSTKALRIMQVTTVMVVLLLAWCGVTLLLRGNTNLPPAPTPSHLQLTKESVGWLYGTPLAQIGFVVMVVAFGHTLLAMSGFETLAQVYREVGYPKLQNLRRTANIVCTYALVATGGVSLLAVMIIPDANRKEYYDNLIAGLVMHLAGPNVLRLAFHLFVVIVGVLILSGAVNTSLIGANGVLSRVAEDGVLLDWFRKPHRRFGTTYRILNLTALLQIATILASRGDMVLLGEAYAFGIVWSFALKALGVLVLRYQRHDQEYKVPLNVRIGSVEVPIGLALTTFVLFLVAIANLFTKQVATVYGVSFTIVLYVLFLISERANAQKQQRREGALEKFNLEHQPQIGAETLRARPGCVLVAVRDYRRMAQLEHVLEKTNVRKHDIVVMTVRPLAPDSEHGLREEQLFTDYEQELFSRVVTMAEKQGKTVELLLVPAVDPYEALVRTAARLRASLLVIGASARMDSDELARQIGLAWERLPEPRHAFSLEIVGPDRPPMYVNLGPHPPRLWPEDLELAHRLWLDLTAALGARLHHRDIVGTALRRMAEDLRSPRAREEVIRSLEAELEHRERPDDAPVV